MKSSVHHIMIVAGEASGDLHGAGLARELLRRRPDLKLEGMGGSAMAAAGVELLRNIDDLAVMGLWEVLGRLFDIRAVLLGLERRLKEAPPDLLVLIDYPGFNLLLAERARRLNIPVLYYISPKVWAWREGRLKKIRRYVDRLAVIFPFEQEYFRNRGVAVDFVGNPLLDVIPAETDRNGFLQRHGIDPASKVIGILPGSRRQELRRMLPLFLAAVELATGKVENPVLLLPLAPTLSERDLADCGLGDSALPVRVLKNENRYEVMAACDAALAASGTVTLELAILGVPTVVSYKVSPVSYYLARRFIRVEYASLVNLIAGREVVPELLQNSAVPAGLASALAPLLTDGAAGDRMRKEMAMVKAMLGAPGASRRTAGLALEMAGRK